MKSSQTLKKSQIKQKPIKLKKQTKLSKSHPLSKSLFDNLNNWMDKKHSGITILILSLCSVLSILLFNLKISEGGDDSTYIEVASNFSKDFFGYYYSFQAPFYSILLSFFIKFWGVNLFLLKALSVVFYLFGIYLFLKAFRGKIPSLILYPIILVTAINSSFLYFASQTYTEAFFMMLQGLMFFAFSKLPEDEEKLRDVYQSWKSWLFFGFIVFLITFTRNVGIVTVGAMVGYLILQKRFIGLGAFLLSFAIFKIPFEIFKSLVWTKDSQYTSQGLTLLRKNPYDASSGNEDFAGLIARFFGNADLYISKRFFQILGFKAEASTTISGGLTLFVTALFLLGIIMILVRKNKILLYTGVYTFLMVAVTFFAVQTRWDQPRLILVFVPFILLVIFYGIYQVLNKTSFALQSVFLYLVAGLLIAGSVKTINQAEKNLPIVINNIKGDKYYGYTPDWRNFLSMSEWCGKNLDDTDLVVSRKASMSFISSNGKKFFPAYSVYSTDPDTLIEYFKDNGVTHMLLASLRLNPSVADDNIINTIHRMAQPIAVKHPEMLTLVHKEGEQEPAYLYKINYKE